MSGHRRAEGGRIDRSRPLRFTFDGRGHVGYAGDTLASALIANGVQLVARSFKYHRPRGILSAGAEEPNALVQLGEGSRSTPNLRATMVALHEGLVAAPVNAWPSVRRDLGAVTGWLAPLLPAGFYYKTFMGPGRAWQRLYEPAIRRMAGMGRVPHGPDPDAYERIDAHCDVLVIGGGPAGLAAALAAGRTGARTVLMDEGPELGGSLLAEPAMIGGEPAERWIAAVEAELVSQPQTRLLRRTTAFGFYDHGYVAGLERAGDHAPEASGVRQRIWHVRARAIVLATGAHERPLVFPGNDRPGVMLAHAARTYARRWAAVPGERAVLFANNDAAWHAALDLHDLGGTLTTVVDWRQAVPEPLRAAAANRGIEVLAGHAVVGTHGRGALYGLEVMKRAGAGVTGRPRYIDADLLLMSGGWSPAVQLFAQSGGRLEFEAARGLFRPNLSAQVEWSVGAAKGTFDLAGCITDGLVAGAQLAHDAGFGDAVPPPVPAVQAADPGGIEPLWLVPGPRDPARDRRKRFVDFQNDVTAADILMAAREGLRSIEHVKRYTTAGMGTDQGKTGNVNALAILGGTLGMAPGRVGTTTFRPPYTPVTFGALAGRDVGALLDPVRTTPLHARHVAAGAVFEDVGQWKRPRFFPRPDEDMAAAVLRECRAVRNAAGLLDASTLGKIDVQGPDAAAFLDRIYTGSMGRLGIGRARYGVMCRDDGFVFDDGVVARLGERHFVLTTTTGNAAAVLDWLEEWLQTEWPELRVFCTSVTEQWATLALSGPNARAVLAAAAPGLALESEAFPHLALREAAVAGVPARILRMSFTGERGYEIGVPGDRAVEVWDALLAAGAAHGLTVYGTEAMHVLRAEKGFFMIGHETDGSVTPLDLGLGRMLARDHDWIGRRGMARAALAAAGRKQLVGLLPENPALVPMEGAQIVRDPDAPPPVPMLGHVTSAYHSATLGRSFALALVKDGRARLNEVVTLVDPYLTLRARIVPPVFYDTEGKRLDA